MPERMSRVHAGQNATGRKNVRIYAKWNARKNVSGKKRCGYCGRDCPFGTTLLVWLHIWISSNLNSCLTCPAWDHSKQSHSCSRPSKVRSAFGDLEHECGKVDVPWMEVQTDCMRPVWELQCRVPGWSNFKWIFNISKSSLLKSTSASCTAFLCNQPHNLGRCHIYYIYIIYIWCMYIYLYTCMYIVYI